MKKMKRKNEKILNVLITESSILFQNVEYNDCITVEREDTPMSDMNMILNT